MENDVITMAHGAGGSLSHALVEQYILSEFGNPLLNELHDGVTIELSGRTAFTTDSYVVKPLFFPGGNIGKLAVCGTVNDLSMTGAVPRYLSMGLILEEGFPLADLRKILHTMHLAAEEAGVYIVTGDTKVVGRGGADGIFINTAGIGDIIAGVDISPRHVCAGMDVILSGFIGDHSAAVMAARHGLELPPEIQSDCAPLNGLTKAMLTAAPQIAVLRDPTRGGIAASLNEIAQQSGTGILLEEDALPIRPEVQGVCDILGFDPLYLANEGKLLAFTRPEDTEKVLAAMHGNCYGREARVIGHTTAEAVGQVGLRTALGGIRIVDMPMGSLVPRIC